MKRGVFNRWPWPRVPWGIGWALAGLVLVAVHGGARADLDVGLRALGRSDYARAYSELRPLAERGYVDAQFSLGQMYAYGWGVDKDETEAARWYREAASRGHDRARRLLLNLCELGVGTDAGLPDARRWQDVRPLVWVRDGRTLCAQAAQQLEAQLAKAPYDTVPRYRLMGFYYYSALDALGAARTVEARRRHVLWLVRNRPQDEVAGFIEAILAPTDDPLADPLGYDEVSRLWQEQAAQPAASEAVLVNAASFHQLHDKPLAERLLLRGQAAHPAAGWSSRLGYLYALGILGVSRLSHNGVPIAVQRAELKGAFGRSARARLERTDDAALAGAAGSTLSQYGSLLMHVGLSKTGEADLAERLLLRAGQLEPANPKWPEWLAEHLRVQAQHAAKSPARRQALQQRALAQLERSLARTPAQGDPLPRLDRLRRAAKLAFSAGEDRRAEQLAVELLMQVNTAGVSAGESGRGVTLAARHDAHVVLGRLALRRKALADAREHLRAAGQAAAAGASFTAFGPNMGLARDLLAVGQGEGPAVIGYLLATRRAWSGPRNLVEPWITEIEAGRKPDFGANLEY